MNLLKSDTTHSRIQILWLCVTVSSLLAQCAAQSSDAPSLGTIHWGREGRDLMDVTYSVHGDGNNLIVSANVGYLSALKAGTPLTAEHFWYTPFRWEVPRLSIKTQNSTPHDIQLNELDVDVNGSTVDTTPIPIFIRDDVFALSFINDGWGPLVGAKITFGLLEIKYCDGPQDVNDSMFVKLHTYDIGSVSDGYRVSVKAFSNEKRFGYQACALGVLAYSDTSNGKWRVPFRTSVILGEPPAGAPAPPDSNYDLFLEAGKSGYSLQLPISQVIPSKGSDHFQVSVFSDKSANFSLSAKVVAVDGSTVAKSNITLNYFLPRSVPTPTTPERLYRSLDAKHLDLGKLSPYVTSIKYDPVHPQDFVIFATEEWMFLTTTQRNQVHSEIEDSLRTLGLPKGDYCYRLADSRCVRSGSFIWK